MNKQKISIYYDNKEIHAKKCCFWLCRIGILNSKSIGKEHLNIFVTEPFTKTRSFSLRIRTIKPTL